MCKRLLHSIGIVSILALSGVTQAAGFTDNFDTPRDYITDGVDGTGWDGFIGKAPGDTVDALNASKDRAGQLFIRSTNSWWEGAFSPRGPFLYKLVQGDFVATVRVTDFAGTAGATVLHNDSFLMARVANLDDAGPGEDFVCIHYFPTWVGNMRRQVNNGTETEGPNTGDGFNCARYLQLERAGNVFTFRRSFDGVTWTAVGATITRDDMAGLTLQVGLAHATYNTTTGYVAFDDFSVSGPMVVPPNRAYNPVPAAGAADVLRNVDLSWKPAATAVKHDLYFGTAMADVTNAGRGNALGVAVGVGQDANTYDPGRLELGRTYYWRVDEVRADGVTIDRGDVWSFTVEPVSNLIKNVTATASSSNNSTMGPEKTVDGSGLNAVDQHSTVATDMWLSKKGGPQPTWIQFVFDKVYKLDKALIWNSNQALESIFGFGARGVTVEYSTDGTTWKTLGEVELAQAPGDPAYEPAAVGLNGAVAKYVKLTINSNWGGLLPQYGLSEVRFFAIPVWAREPNPASGKTAVDSQTPLSWRAGREAASHQVYVSTDKQQVLDGTAPVSTVSDPSFEPPVGLGQTYYWKVTEVNEAMSPKSWEGDVWSFSTQEALVVDDFESYTDEKDHEIFTAWIDGYSSGSSGSQVGYLQAPFAERTIVHGGRQAMPLAYDNNKAPRFSETERAFHMLQDWSKYGITTLVIWFRGDPNNTAAPLYAKINGTKILFNKGAPSTAFGLWKQWNIDLASLGISLKSVKTLTIGVGDGAAGGTGTLFIDDILLYAAAPQVVAPVDPGTNGLVLLYAMEGNVQDTSGKGNNGTVSGEPAYGTGPNDYGKALKFDGLNDYVTLPIGTLLSSLSNITVATWVNYSGTGGGWQRVWDFGTGTTNYMFVTPAQGTTGPMTFAIRTATVAERRVVASGPLPTGWHHVAVVIDGGAMTAQVYLDGAVVAGNSVAVLPKNLGVTNQNWIGRSQFTADAFFNGAVDDFRIYNRAMSAAEIRYLAGDR
jgi:hypothetical protein